MAPQLRSTLRRYRLAAGLSQRGLAEMVGVTRQALIAIEAGRQVPSTMLALQLARALRCAVEDLFAMDGHQAVHASMPQSSPGAGARVFLGLVDGRWAAHPCDVAGESCDALVDGRSASGDAIAQPLTDPNALERKLLVAGCAPLLAVLGGQLGRRYADAHATWIRSNSTQALEHLRQGLVHVAGVHLVETSIAGGHAAVVQRELPNAPTTIVNLACWRQGLVVAPGNPLDLKVAGDLARPGVRVARREAGSGSDRLLRRLLGTEQNPTVGPTARSHAEIAGLVRWDVADVGIAIEAAAAAAGLEFLPLSEERFDLLVPTHRLADVAVGRLLDHCASPVFRAEASTLVGYDLKMSGDTATVAGTVTR